jgi:hypothetical protein
MEVIIALVFSAGYSPERIDSKVLRGPNCEIWAVQKKCPGSMAEKRMARASKGVRKAGVCMYIRHHVKTGR